MSGCRITKAAAQVIRRRTRWREFAVARLKTGTPLRIVRGAGQVADAFEILRLRHGIDEAGFRARPHTYTVINTNSPLILDIPVCQGLIITPFTLSGP